MKSYDFIFSNRISFRLVRNISFWLAFFLYFFYVNLLPASTADLFSTKTYFASLQLMIYMPLNILAVYITLYILLPRFIYPGKWRLLVFFMIGLVILYFILAYLTTMLLAILTLPTPFSKLPVSYRWFRPVRYGIGFPMTATVLVSILKIFKNMQLEQKENEILLREKINTEIQLLKTRFQPQFLYNALQSIISLAGRKSAESASTLLKLSELLSYILYENEKDRVLLEKEIEILKNFLILNKTFYPSVVNIRFSQETEKRDLYISPLVLLSIVEICFDNMQAEDSRQIHLSLHIRTIGNELQFQLEIKRDNETVSEAAAFNNKLQQALQRIELLYANRYSVDFFNDNGTVSLVIGLKLSANPVSSIPFIIKPEPV